jgi:hypothetical protein
MEYAPNSAEEKKYLQKLIKKYSRRHLINIVKNKNGERNT